MNILAIDTASQFLSLAIATKDQLLSSQKQVGTSQTQHILPSIRQLLQEAQLELTDLDLIAYNQGPGSFTGLRIGLGIGLGLAYAHNLPLMPIPAFALYLNHECSKFNYVIVSLDARLEQIYLAIINTQSGGYLVAPCIVTPEELSEKLNNQRELTSHNSAITGNGYLAYAPRIATALNKSFTFVEQTYPQPQQLIKIAQANLYPQVTVFQAELLYLRNKVALNLDEQQRNRTL